MGHSRQAFKELNLDLSDSELTIRNYANYIVGCVLKEDISPYNALSLLERIYLNSHGQDCLWDFYVLSNIKDSVRSGITSHWGGVEIYKGNIDSIIDEYFKHWNTKFDISPLQ